MTKDRHLRGRTALITGASAGIGAAFAAAYAARGVDLLLTARRDERMRALADELRRAHGVRIEVIAGDLADPATPALLEQAIAQRGLAIDILVNNAGFGVPGNFLDVDWPMHRVTLQVMIGAVAELTYRLLPGMRARGFGRIVNVGSVAGLLPALAGQTLYAPVKAWMVPFSEGLAIELRDSGVNVCALCPGFTHSEFHDVAGTRAQVSRMPRWVWASAEAIAEAGIDAVERGEPVYVCGRLYRGITLLARWLPRALVRRLVGSHGRRYRRRPGS
jgi:hypothetical protein